MALDKAVALRHDEHAENGAPMVVAKGSGETARTIREIAAAHGIPIRSDSDLVEILSTIELDSEIPPELYAAVAELLSWVYRANDSIKKEVFQ